MGVRVFNEQFAETFVSSPGIASSSIKTSTYIMYHDVMMYLCDKKNMSSTCGTSRNCTSSRPKPNAIAMPHVRVVVVREELAWCHVMSLRWGCE
jgi:hypothetical protein